KAQAKGGGALRIPPNVADLAKLAATEDHRRYALTNVLVQEQGEGYRVIATDGHRVGMVAGSKGKLATVPPALKGAGNGATEALLPARDFQRVVKSPGGVRLVLGDAGATSLPPAGVKAVAKSPGRFPDAEELLPADEPVASVVIDAKG